MSDHTSGEWYIDWYKGETPYFVATKTEVICLFSHHERIKRKTLKTNARLIVTACNAAMKVNPDNPIAAAEALPDLLEACKAVAESTRGEHLSTETVVMLMDAIAKAEGPLPR